MTKKTTVRKKKRTIRAKVRALTAPTNIVVRKIDNGYLVESAHGRKQRALYLQTHKQVKDHLAKVW